MTEQNFECEHVSQEDIRPTGEFAFGSSPVADSCTDLKIECFYDEIFSDKQPLLRWFEVRSDSPIFDISIDPVDYEELINKDFEDIEILNFAAVNDGYDNGLVA